MNARLLLTLMLGTLTISCDGGGTVQNIDVEEDPKADSSKSVNIGAGDTVNVTLKTSGSSRTITVDCGVDADPDVSTFIFSVTSADLGVTSSNAGPAREGFWRWTGDLAAGSHSLTIKGKAGGATCKVKSGKTPSSTCTASRSFHSANSNHTHFSVGTETAKDWEEPFPTSGNHWGAWAAWNTVYDAPVKRPFLMHNLEHGGLVLSYNCSSESQSTDCQEAANNLKSLTTAFGEARVIVTPDPKQPTRYAARAWRWGYESDCFDSSGLKSFMTSHFRHGREDIDADPPLPYDPTTTNVPCQDLMAAPDSCN